MAEEGKAKLIQVMAEIQKQPDGLLEFGADPVGYLERRGINADGLTLTTEPSRASGEVTEAEMALVAGAGCYSLGYYACYNYGE